MPTFHHEKLTSYRKAVELVAVASEIVPAINPAQAHLRSQLARAASSVALNIAEGAGEFRRPEKRRFHRMARRSATECTAIVSILRAVGFGNGELLDRAEALLDELVAMLTTMSRPEGQRKS